MPVYPNLVRVDHDGKPTDAVAQVTKTGYVFLFDRETGKPLFEIKDIPVPASDVPGERASPTQPIPVKPPPSPPSFSMRPTSPTIGEANRASRPGPAQNDSGGPAFNPPSLQGTVVIPGFHGGANWSGASFDPTTGRLYVNSNNVPNIVTLAERRRGHRSSHGPSRPRDTRDFSTTRAIRRSSPLGHADRDRPEYGRIRLAGPTRRARRADRPRNSADRHREFGGTIVTAGGLVFIAGTKDERIHAFDKQTGKLLWEHPLPAGGYATPSTYR